MNSCRWNLIALLTLGLTWGCSGMRGQPFDPSLAGRELYLCCNTGFNPQFVASDANYGRYRSELGYSSGPILAAGTRVRVTKVGGSGCPFGKHACGATPRSSNLPGHLDERRTIEWRGRATERKDWHG